MGAMVREMPSVWGRADPPKHWEVAVRGRKNLKDEREWGREW